MKRALKSLANAAGLELFRYGVRYRAKPVRIASLSYTSLFPEAKYAPWLDDEEFQTIYQKIRENTLVDQYRCYELWSLVQQVAHLDGDLLEVGVWRGGTGAIIAAASAKVPGTRTIYLADTFRGVVKAGEKDPGFRGGEHADTSREHVTSLLRANLLSNTVVLEGVFPDDFRDIAGRRFSFVHVDVDTYRSARDIVEVAWPNIPVGGMVVFDDYGSPNCSGIAQLVNEYRKQRDRIFVHNLNGHALMIRR
jgi:O-methyltransferase